MNTSFIVRRLHNSATQVKVTASIQDLINECPELGLRSPTKDNPLCLTLADGAVVRLEGYPTGSLVNQEAGVQTRFTAILGKEEAMETPDLEVKSVAFGKPVRKGSIGTVKKATTF